MQLDYNNINAFVFLWALWVEEDVTGRLAVLQVARRTFIRALRERNSVILVPGGQAELIHTGRLFTNKEFVIYPKHKGGPRFYAFKLSSSGMHHDKCHAKYIMRIQKYCCKAKGGSVDLAGFVRLAAQHGASLVPVLAFGELDTLRNFVDLPAVQVWQKSPSGIPLILKRAGCCFFSNILASHTAVCEAYFTAVLY